MIARLFAVLAATVILVGTAVPAAATPATEVVQGDVLRLVSVADWAAAAELSSGQDVQWDVTVSADAPDPGILTLGVSASGTAALRLDVATCSVGWVGAGCPGESETLKSAWSVPRDGLVVDLLSMTDQDTARIRLSVSLGAGAQIGSTEIHFHARGESETVVIGSHGVLAETGMPGATQAILAGGFALTAVGVVLGVAHRRRRGAGGRASS